MVLPPAKRNTPIALGGYWLGPPLASGGMATVHLGIRCEALRSGAQASEAEVVAIKRMHPHLVADPEFVTMFLDEGHLTGLVRHPNVVAIREVLRVDSELLLVMEYVPGVALSQLFREAKTQGRRIPHPIAIAMISDVLLGLEAAHNATNSRGEALQLIHRDVSPQNLVVDLDGRVKLLDFGVAKALGRLRTTRDVTPRGKVQYMAPEQLSGKASQRTDLFAAALILWELLTMDRVYGEEGGDELFGRVLNPRIPPAATTSPDVPQKLDRALMRCLRRDPAERYSSATEFRAAIIEVVAPATAGEVAAFARQVSTAAFENAEHARSNLITQIRSSEVFAAPASETLESITVTSKVGPRRTRGTAIRIAALFGALLVLGGGYSLSRNRRADPASPSPSAPAGTPATAPGAPMTEPAPGASEIATPVVSATISEPPRKTTRPSSTPPGSMTKRPAARPAVSCQPPFRYDAQGHKIPKSECF